MTDIVFVLMFSIVVFILDLRQTWDNMNVPWNGLGSIENTLAGKSQQPMQYRVLVPWLCALLGKTRGAYLAVKGIGVISAISFSYLYFGAIGAPAYLAVALLSLFFVLAAIFDYADTYWEVGLTMAAFWLLVAHPISWLVFFITILAALNRETGGIVPLGAVLMGMYWESILLFVAFGVGYAIPRLRYGVADRYCSIWMLPENLKRLREVRWRDWVAVSMNDGLQFLILVALFVYAALNYGSGLELAGLILFTALLLPAIWGEIRVFAVPTALMIPIWLR